jgi:hypothetical protein
LYIYYDGGKVLEVGDSSSRAAVFVGVMGILGIGISVSFKMASGYGVTAVEF